MALIPKPGDMKKPKFGEVLLIAILIVAAFLIVTRGRGTAVYTQSATAVLSGDTFSLILADNPQERMQGLSGREKLSAREGMLFVFEEKSHWGFWMNDMNFPIDIIWLDEDYGVVGIKELATPESYPETFYPHTPALYVLEFNAGTVARYGIEMGDQIAISITRGS